MNMIWRDKGWSRNRRQPSESGVSALSCLIFDISFHLLPCSSKIVYGDLSTSPLYVLNGVFPPTGAVPSEEDVLGIIS